MSTAVRHVLISGGTRGLGRSMVLALLAAGYAVSTFSRRPSAPDLPGELEDRYCVVQADIAQPADVLRFVEHARERFGTPFALVNNAAIALEGVLPTFPVDDIDRLLQTNLGGTLQLTRAVVRAMLLGREGRIVNVSSIAASHGYRGLSVYAATKAGIEGMTRALARELGVRQITVNALAPGYVETDMTSSLDENQRRRIVNRTPLGRLGRTEDVTGALLFLLSDAARFITGQTLTIDGGLTC